MEFEITWINREDVKTRYFGEEYGNRQAYEYENILIGMDSLEEKGDTEQEAIQKIKNRISETLDRMLEGCKNPAFKVFVSRWKTEKVFGMSDSPGWYVSWCDVGILVYCDVENILETLRSET